VTAAAAAAVGIHRTVGEAIGRLAYARGRLELLVPRGHRQLHPAGGFRGPDRPAAPAPINPGVLDLIAVFDWQVLHLDSVTALWLGDRRPRFRLHALCPYCGLAELAVDMDAGVIRCPAWPACQDPEGRRYEWRGEPGMRQLAALLVDRDSAELAALAEVG
jgi:hypothetical protein